MIKDKRRPSIRFPGFEDDWEHRKFGDEMYIKSRVGWQALTKKEYLEQGDYYLITGTDIDETTHTVDLTKSWYVSKDRYEMDENIQVRNGDLIITKDGTIGKVAFIKGLDKPATLNSHLFLVRDLSGKLDSGFLFQILNSWVFQSFIERVKTGSTLTGLPQKTIVEFEFPYPSLEEQRQISNFLGTVDDTITLHQQKLDDLKNLKSGLLQKMFPQKGEKVPQVRFPGFTGDWEQCKLSDLCDVRDGTHDSPKYYDQGYPLVTSKNVADGYVDTTNVDLISEEDYESINKRSKVDVGDILMGMIGTIGNLALVKEEPAYAIKNVALLKSTNTINPDFLLAFLSAPQTKKHFSFLLSGGTQKFLSLNQIRNLSVTKPIDDLEIQKIGLLFTNLDNTINLHHQKINDLNRLKDGLLQKMFP